MKITFNKLQRLTRSELRALAEYINTPKLIKKDGTASRREYNTIMRNISKGGVGVAANILDTFVRPNALTSAMLKLFSK